MLVFTHIPKTGGTTVNLNYIEGTRPIHQFRIKGNYERDKIYTFRSGARRSPTPDWPSVSFDVPSPDIINLISFLNHADISGIKIIKGHLPYGVHHYIEQPCYYFTVLRQPIARVWSVYNGVMADKDHYLHGLWRDKYQWNFKKILEDRPPELCNDQFRMMTGTSQLIFGDSDQKLIPDVVNKYSYVTTSNRISRMGSDFGYLFGWKHLQLKTNFNIGLYNNTFSPKPPLGLAKLITDYNQLDIILYCYVMEKELIFNLSKGEPHNDRNN